MATEEGELMHYDVDYKYLVTSDKNNFDQKIFKKSIDEFNLKLGKTPSNYEIDVFYSNSFRFQSIGYKSGKDSFFVDGVSGKVIGYFSSIENTSLYGNIASEDGKEIAKKYAVELNNYDLKDFDFIKKEYDRYSNETKYVFKKERADKVIYIEIHLNSNNELTRFAEREYLNPDYFKDNKINITKKDAVKMILKKYSPLEVYNTKAVPFYAVYKDGTSGLAWLVSITQFKSIQTQSYLVFSNDGSITALSDYQEGE